MDFDCVIDSCKLPFLIYFLYFLKFVLLVANVSNEDPSIVNFSVLNTFAFPALKFFSSSAAFSAVPSVTCSSFNWEITTASSA